MLHDMTRLIFHITTSSEWDAAVAAGKYVAPSLEDEGFVHCSFRGQVQPTADRFYAGRDDVVLLVVDPRRLTSPVRVEPVAGPGSERFPHVYGPIDLDAVVDRAAVPVGPDGRLDIAATGLAG